MVVEGVLRSPGSDGHIDEGVTLYRSLVTNSRLYLMSNEWDQDEMDAWLFKNGLRGHIAFQWMASSSCDDRIDALSKLRTWNPAIVIESDPACAAVELRHGYPTLLLARPFYADARWRPDASRGPQPWDEVEAELKRQESLRYADARLRESL